MATVAPKERPAQGSVPPPPPLNPPAKQAEETLPKKVEDWFVFTFGLSVTPLLLKLLMSRLSPEIEFVFDSSEYVGELLFVALVISAETLHFFKKIGNKSEKADSRIWFSVMADIFNTISRLASGTIVLLSAFLYGNFHAYENVTKTATEWFVISVLLSSVSVFCGLVTHFTVRKE